MNAHIKEKEKKRTINIFTYRYVWLHVHLSEIPSKKNAKGTKTLGAEVKMSMEHFIREAGAHKAQQKNSKYFIKSRNK